MNQEFTRDADAIIHNFEDRSRDIQYVTDRLKSITPLPNLRSSSPPVSYRRVIHQGPKGGLYYISAGKKIYLTPGQCHRCEAGNYGDAGCPPMPPRRGSCQSSRVSLKRKIRRLKRSRRSLKRRLSKKKDC